MCIRDSFEAGERHGEYLKFNIQGKLIEKKMYIKGNIDGEWFRYNDVGQLIDKKIYDDGVLIKTIKP